MERSYKLEALTNELSASVKRLAAQQRAGSSHQYQNEYRSITNIATQIQNLVAQPAEFLKRLVCQTQMLACLQWLAEFQVLACIPLSGSVPLQDVADLAGVPAGQLSRIVRLMSANGFLSEPLVGQIAHTHLSAEFVTNLSYFDASMFLARTAAPTALKMAATTQQYGCSTQSQHSAYAVAFGTDQSFKKVCQQHPKIQRQWLAYWKHIGSTSQEFVELMAKLDWLSLGTARIVDVNADSAKAATVLADLHPALHFVVQMRDHVPDGKRVHARVTIQNRQPGTMQTVGDAAVYLLRLPSPALGLSSSMLTTVKSELRAHVDVLRDTNAMLVLIASLSSQCETEVSDLSADARARDLSLLQLTNESELMEMHELSEAVKSIRDDAGRMIIVSKFQARNSALTALGLKFQAFTSD